MKGYKGMESDMTCRGFQYEIGKEYHTDEKIKLCENGFHFCKNLKDVFYFYHEHENNRFFEVEGHTIESDNMKCVADKIRIIRELTEKEVNRCYYGDYGDDYYGNGYGDGYYGNGYGDGYGDGNGYGDGYYGNGYGDGYGDDNGCGCGDGNGDGYGFGDGLNIERVLQFI